MRKINNKNIIIKIFVFLFIFLEITTVKAKTIKLKEVEYTDEYVKWLETNPKKLKDIAIPLIFANDTKDKFVFYKANSKLVNVDKSASSFNLKDYGLITDIKDQGITGSCWAFAAIASIESNLLIQDKGKYDLSEAHLELSTQKTYDYGRVSFNREADSGGNYYFSSAYFRNNWGPIQEETLPFNELLKLYDKDHPYTIPATKIVDNKAVLDIDDVVELGISEPGVCSDNAKNDIKEYLITNGAISAKIYLNVDQQLSDYYYYDGKEYTDLNSERVAANQSVNHAVTIVGWNDNISKTNFTSGNNHPQHDGAWIIKNSYGEKVELGTMDELRELLFRMFQQDEEFKTTFPTLQSVTDAVIKLFFKTAYDVDDNKINIIDNKLYITVGMDGYQYVSYDDIYACYGATGYFNVNDEVEKYTYGYDPLGYDGALTSENENTFYMASYFNKQASGNEKLKEINTYFYEPGYKYEIYFYNGESLDLNEATMIASGTSDFVGYKTIKLENQPVISEKKYTIIIKLSAEDKDQIYFPISYNPTSLASTNNPFSTFKEVEGVQFLSTDGINYGDTTKDSNYKFHFIIKAYTDDTTEEPSSKPEQPDPDNPDPVDPVDPGGDGGDEGGGDSGGGGQTPGGTTDPDPGDGGGGSETDPPNPPKDDKDDPDEGGGDSGGGGTDPGDGGGSGETDSPNPPKDDKDDPDEGGGDSGGGQTPGGTTDPTPGGEGSGDSGSGGSTGSDNKPTNPSKDEKPNTDSSIEIDQNEYNSENNPINSNNNSTTDETINNPKTGSIVISVSGVLIVLTIGFIVIKNKKSKIYKI